MTVKNEDTSWEKYPHPYIDTAMGKAYYSHTEIEDEHGRWDDHWETVRGEWVIHEGDKHYVYIVYKRCSDCDGTGWLDGDSSDINNPPVQRAEALDMNYYHISSIKLQPISKPQGYYEAVDESGSLKYWYPLSNSSPIFPISNIKEFCFATTPAGAMIGAFSDGGQAGEYYLYSTEQRPDVDLTHETVQDFGVVGEVRYRRPVKVKLLGKLQVTSKIISDILKCQVEIDGDVFFNNECGNELKKRLDKWIKMEGKKMSEEKIKALQCPNCGAFLNLDSCLNVQGVVAYGGKCTNCDEQLLTKDELKDLENIDEMPLEKRLDIAEELNNKVQKRWR